MMELFENKYKINSTRLIGKDYSDDGSYFVTICTKNRKIFFGNIKDSKMILNSIGKIIAEEWQKTELIRDGVRLDKWIVMPNHLHGIIIINQNYKNWLRGNIKKVNMVGGEFDKTVKNKYVETPRWGVSKKQNNETPHRGVSTDHKLEWQPNSLGSIINQIKSICTKRINREFPNLNFAWQTRFHEHIIRKQESLENIRDYILNNPHNWELDRNNPKIFNIK